MMTRAVRGQPAIIMRKTAHELQDRICRLIRDNHPREPFDAIALDVFKFQYSHNAPYRAFCDHQGATPSSIVRWSDIPAVPTTAFKHHAVACFPLAQAVAEFHTSGTTQHQTGRHWFPSLDLYKAALRPQFVAHLLPDNARPHMVILTPPPAHAPHSSLVFMLGELASEFSLSATFHDADHDAALEHLSWLGQQPDPVAVLGTAFAFVNLCDHMRGRNNRLSLPAGSRVMETGGFKGRSREVSKPDLYATIADRLGVPSSHIVNEYGMTELSTQFYDLTMRAGKQSDRKSIPAWTRILVINPHTGLPAAIGERGLIRVLDLANLWSAACVQTEDFGVLHDDGFEIVGRATGAEARGCSLLAEPGTTTP